MHKTQDKTKRFISTPNYVIHFLPSKKFSIFIQAHSVTTPHNYKFITNFMMLRPLHDLLNNIEEFKTYFNSKHSAFSF